MSYISKLKKSLNKCIDNISDHRSDYCLNPGKDFTRNRKADFSSVLKTILCFGGKSLNKELYEAFGLSPDTLTPSAFVQQRSKIKPDAFYDLFRSFSESNQKVKLFHGYRLLAVDGSDIYTPANKDDIESFHSRNSLGTFNSYHLNALYDLLSNTYLDAVIQNYRQFNEHLAYVKMIDRFYSSIPAIFIADRGFESYNGMAHVQERNQKFLTRIKDIHSSGILKRFELPDGEFDISLDVNITRKSTKEIRADPLFIHIAHDSPFDFIPPKTKIKDPAVFYTLHLRFVRIKHLKDSYEVLVTNLDKDSFPPSVLKELYSMRWGVETSFRKLKHTIGLNAFHSKKSEHIFQEIFARLTFYNFSEFVTSHIAIRKMKRKHLYKINFSVAVYACRNFLLGRYAPRLVEDVIGKNILPHRPNLLNPRNPRFVPPLNFIYRIA